MNKTENTENTAHVRSATARFRDLLAGALERVCVLEEIVERERAIGATLQGEVERLAAENAELAKKAKNLEARLARAKKRRPAAR